ncbi:MAG: malto-oligosyltrehalose trehalohydrolase, partial [Chloroflexota bacterium]
DLHLLEQNQYVPMTRDERGYFACTVDDVQVGDRYLYRLDNDPTRERPDPASRWQPDGVHGASAITNPDFAWTDQTFSPPTLRNSIFYELHVGTFTEEGTFDAIIPHLDRLAELGITSLQLMPIAQCPGERNWGYDGVQLYAAQSNYGGIDGLRALVNEAHNRNMAVYLDLVCNHLGPEGNYLWDFAPYFTDHYRTSWGEALNFDGAYSDEVRKFFIDNALYWLEVAHIDGFRLDATHALYDFSAVPFLEKLTTAIQDWGDAHNKRVHVIAENDMANRKLLLPREVNGTGLDGQWLDDLHHCIHTHLTGEGEGYYADFVGFDRLVKCLREGFVRSGDWSPSRKRHLGTYSGDIPADRFIVASQTHDQIGNRIQGERLHQLTDWAGAQWAAGITLLSPYVPMLFMGQAYADPNPFLYFTSHSDPVLIENVRAGRKREFAYFADQGDPPDPQAEDTFERSKIQPDLHTSGKHKRMYQLYKDLIALRKKHPALTNPDRNATTVYANPQQQII